MAYLHGFGGAEKQITILANQLSLRKHEVHFIVLGEDNRCYEIDPEVNVHSLIEVEKGNKIHKILNRRKILVKKLKELRCDIVINFNFQSAYLLAFSNKKSIGKVLYSERGDPGDKEYSGILGIIRKITLHHIDAFVFQSKGAQEYFNDEYVRSRSDVIPNACFYRKQIPYGEKRDKRIVSVGRLSEQKNQKILIEAFAKNICKYPDYALELYGDGELKTDLVSLCKKLCIEDKVHFMGTTKEIRDRIRTARLFVLSSDYEGIPNALIEAMALGLPCISTDCKPGGARTLITSGKDGLITPINDSELLAEAIDYMLSHPNEAERMAANAADIADRLSADKIYDKWEDFLLNNR